jgi:hypothetical protein
MFKLRADKEAWSIARAVFFGMAIVIAGALAVGLAADKVFSDHLWPRLVTAVLIVLALGFVFFRKRERKK